MDRNGHRGNLQLAGDDHRDPRGECHAVFADVSITRGTLCPTSAAMHVTRRTRALLVTHLFRIPADMSALRALADHRGLALLADASHTLGARWNNQPITTCIDIAALSLGLGKLVSCGEGGMLDSADPLLYPRALLVSQRGS